MNKHCALLLLLPPTSFTFACGSGTTRQLQSIAITQTANGEQIEFVATGKFSSSPATVTPIPVEWSVQLLAPPPQQYMLTTQPFLFKCTASGPFPTVAYAPSDANASASGSWSGMVQASNIILCP